MTRANQMFKLAVSTPLKLAAMVQRRHIMAKDQFKVKVKSEALTTRFQVLPLVEKGEENLCVDANFNFLVVSKARLDEFAEIALPETFDQQLFEQAKLRAKQYLPADPKKVEGLVVFLKNNGAKGFQEALEKSLAN